MELGILLWAAYLAVIAFLLWLVWPIIMGAMYMPTPHAVVEKMLDLAGVGPEDTVYDLGSGDGRIVIGAAERGARAVGIEVDPIRVLWARRNAAASRAGRRVRIIWGDFFKNSVADATVVTVYQGEGINNRLRQKFEVELKPGSRVVSFSFKFDGWEIAEKHPDADIYLYRVPAKA